MNPIDLGSNLGQEGSINDMYIPAGFLESEIRESTNTMNIGDSGSNVGRIISIDNMRIPPGF
jgi:hypothetical protein